RTEVCALSPLSHTTSRGCERSPANRTRGVWQAACDLVGTDPLMTAVASVLIVDDEPAVRELMARWVASLGMRPQTAANAEEALATLRNAHYDLAVIDVQMPGRNGLWLAAEMRRDHPHTAVVISTAFTDL